MSKYLLSREEDKKLSYLRLGTNFNIPKEIILLIYNLNETDKKEEEELIRIFHRNIILFHTLNPVDKDYHKLFSSGVVLNNSYQYLFPIGRGIEWPISNIKLKIDQLLFTDDPIILNNTHPRNILLCQIKMMGDKDFLNIDTGLNIDTPIYSEATLKHKINFMNSHSYIDIFNRYINYQEWKHEIDNNEWDWRIIITDYLGHYYYFD